ncbi:MAG: hypothetical protein GQ570_08905 [Helicobacteraceae bacterium]|nr:hypothetical protein [Helicobacteraceae bacterium]
MKNNILKISTTTLVLSLLLVGCGAKPEVESAKQTFECVQDGIEAPAFTCNPYFEGSIVALGVAKMNAGNDKEFQRVEAMSSGRDALARTIEVKVDNLFKKYKGTTGTGENATFDKVSSDVSKQLASQTLKGSKQVGNSWRHPETQELFILVAVTNEPVIEGIGEVVTTSFKNDTAMYQQFVAEKANGELNRELEKANK